jgi:WD40 repeat protein
MTLFFSSVNWHHHQLVDFNEENLIVFGSKNSIVLFDFKEKKIMANLTGHSSRVTSVIFINNSTIASSSEDKSIFIWDLNSKSIKSQHQKHKVKKFQN